MNNLFKKTAMLIMAIFTSSLEFLQAQPPNDQCNGAVNVPSNDTAYQYVIGNIFSATPSGSNVPKCAGREQGNYQDAWFKFTATNTSHRIAAAPCLLCFTVDLDFALYSGNCNNLNLITCGVEPVQFISETKTVNNLTIGNVYYIRVYEYNQNNNLNANDFRVGVKIPTTTNINDAQMANELFIGPNPFQNNLQLRYKQQGGVFNIYNASGQQIFKADLTTNTTNIDTENWPTGIYFYTLQTLNDHTSGRLIKN